MWSYDPMKIWFAAKALTARNKMTWSTNICRDIELHDMADFGGQHMGKMCFLELECHKELSTNVYNTFLDK